MFNFNFGALNFKRVEQHNLSNLFTSIREFCTFVIIYRNVD